MQPTPAPSRDLDPSKNKVHMLGSFFSLYVDSEFSLFFELVGLLKLENTYNLSLDTMLDCTLELVSFLSSMLQWGSTI